MTKPHDGQLWDRLYQIVKVEEPIEDGAIRRLCIGVPAGEFAATIDEMVRAGALKRDNSQWPKLFYSLSERGNAMNETGKTQSTELPPGWQWHYRDPKARSFIAEKPGQDIRSPGFPDEAQAAHWAQMKEESLREDSVIVEARTLESALYAMLQSVCPPKTGWEPLKQSGATDAELIEALSIAFGEGGKAISGASYKGGKSPEFAWPDPAQTLKGKRLLAKAREVLEIGPPGGQVEDVAPGKPQVNEFGVYVRGVEAIKIPLPSKAGKTKVEIRVVQDGKDDLWRSAHSTSIGMSGQSSAPSLSGAAYESREQAIGASGQQAREFLVSQLQLRPRAYSDAARRGIAAAIEALDGWTAAHRVSVDSSPLPSSSRSNAMQSNNGTYQIHMLALGDVKPSATNPRKIFDEDKLRELAESIKLQGLVQPIVVRPLANGCIVQQYEIVAGERRYRAAKIARIEKIPAIVRDLDDKAALEIQVIENLQRSDLSPIEEAEGYKVLLDQHGYTADELASKIGKSKSYVYARLKIRSLPQQALNALAAGAISPSVAELIGRLPSMELREKFWDAEFDDELDERSISTPTYLYVKREIERRYMRELKGAPFDQGDAKLLPEAGNCKRCPKRTGNNRVEYPDGRADVCTDVGCYDRKVKASNERLLAAASDEGAIVLNKAEAKKFFPHGGSLSWDKQDEFVDLGDECYDALTEEEEDENKPAPTYQALLGDVKPEVVGLDERGNLHRLVSKSVAAELLRNKHGIEIEHPKRAGGATTDEALKRQSGEYLKRKARQAALEEIAAKVEQWFGDEFAIRRNSGAEFSLDSLDSLVAIVTRALLLLAPYPQAVAVIKRRGVNVTGQVGPAVDQIKLEAGDAIGLLAELCVRQELSQWSYGYTVAKILTPICDFAGINYEEFEKRALKALKDAEKPKPKPKSKKPQKESA